MRENENKTFIIEDSISPSEKCPLTQSEFERLLELFENEQENQQIIKLYDLVTKIPSIDEISSKIAQSLDYLEILQSRDRSSVENWEIFENQEIDFDGLINIMESAIQDLDRIQAPWLLTLIEPCSTNQVLKDHIEKINEELKSIVPRFNEKRNVIHLLEIQTAIPINDEKSYEQFCRDFDPWYKCLKENGSIGFFSKLTNKKSSYILEKSRINNTEIDTFEKAELLRHYAEYCIYQYRLEYLWKMLSSEYGGSPLDLLSSVIMLNY